MCARVYKFTIYNDESFKKITNYSKNYTNKQKSENEK